MKIVLKMFNLKLKKMKNFRKLFGLLFLSVLIMTSCDKKDEVKVEDIRPTSEEFSALVESALDEIKQEFQIDADGSIAVLTSEKGVQIRINTGCLNINGNPVSGNVDVKFVEIFNKGNMLVTDKPTMGVMPDGNKAMLISGGEFLVELTQNGTELDTDCGFQLTIPADLTGGPDQNMTLWKGEINEDGDLVWEEEKEGANGDRGELFVEGNVYYAFISDFGWTNVDRFYSDPRPKTTILVDVPEGYDNLNSSVYLSYDGEGPGLANLDTYNPSTGLFSEHYGQIPIGLECHVIFISAEDENYRYAVKAVTIVDNGIIVISEDDLSVATQAQLTQIINDLP